MYECMNDLGANVATILDDNQMGYTSMEEYNNLSRIEKFWNEKKDAKFDLAMVEKKNTAETVDFVNSWDAGIKMDWKLVPKEDQVPHINWRQSLTDDGSKLMRLASFTGNEANAGKNLVKDSVVADVMKKNKEAIDSYAESLEVNFKSDEIKKAREEGKTILGATLDPLLNRIRRGFQAEVKEIIGDDEKVDSILIISMAQVYNMEPKDIYEKYKGFMSTVQTTNPTIGVTAFTGGNIPFIGDKEKKAPRIDEVLKEEEKKSSDSNSSTDSNSSSNKPKPTSSSDKEKAEKEKKDKQKLPPIKWDERDGWLWVAYAGHHMVNYKHGDGTMNGIEKFPAVCYLYCELDAKAHFSRYDEKNFSFPFTDKELKNPGVIMGEAYGKTADGKMHNGTQFLVQKGTPFFAVADGRVTGCGNDGEYAKEFRSINVQHNDGTFARYMCASQISVKRGDTVIRGQALGVTGTDEAAKVDCLYFELGQGDSEKSICPSDPMHYFPKINYKKGEEILATGAKPKDKKEDKKDEKKDDKKEEKKEEKDKK